MLCLELGACCTVPRSRWCERLWVISSVANVLDGHGEAWMGVSEHISSHVHW